MSEKNDEKKSEANLSEMLLNWTEKIGRRGALRKLTMGSLGFVTGLFGVSKETYAAGGTCCNLCKSSTPNCAEFCCWQWACCNASSSYRVYICKECYAGACTGGCKVACSEAIRLTYMC
jgi:hypothetical protein